jgi:putative FmdB family regulatory protein
MPIYEYFCPKCNEEFELMRPFSQSNETAPCPRCGTAGQKLISLFGSTVDKYTMKVPEKAAFRKKPAARKKRGK